VKGFIIFILHQMLLGWRHGGCDGHDTWHAREKWKDDI